MNSTNADLNKKLSTLETNLIKGNKAVIQKVSKIDSLEKFQETQKQSFENVYQVQNELKTLNVNMNSMLENVCNANLVALSSGITALAKKIDKVDVNMNGAKEEILLFYSIFYILLEIENNQYRDEFHGFSSVMVQNKNETIEFLRRRFDSMSMVHLEGGKNHKEGIVYVNGKDALFVHHESIFSLIRQIFLLVC